MSIKQDAVKKALAMLKAANAMYRIIEEDGTEYTNIVEKKKLREYQYPRGALTNYIRPHLMPMEAGDLVEIPVGEFNLQSIQSAATSWFCNNRGNGSCMSSVNKDKNVVEVIRIS